MRFMRQIDGLRACAVAAVFFHHFVMGRLEFGTFGVILFFVISGFLITGILLDAKERIGARTLSIGSALRLFYIRRTLRIFPLYFFVLAVMWAFNVGSVRHLIGWLATYTLNIWVAVHHSFPEETGHFWSLAVEEQFYLVWPFVVLLVRRRFLRPLMFAFIASAVGFRAIGKIVFHLNPTINALTIAQLDSLSCGGVLPLGNPFDKKMLRRLGTYLSPLLAVELIAAYLSIGLKIRWMSLELLCALCSAALVSYAADGMSGLAGRFLSSGVMTSLGRVSYGLYVYHMPIYVLVGNRALAVLLTIAVAFASWYVIERPINSLKRHFEYGEVAKKVAAT